MVEFLQKAERFSKNWVKLSGNIRGIVWLSIGAFLFSITDVIVKLLGRKFDPMELALFRYGIGMIILTPIFLKMGLENLKTKKIGLHIIRMLLAMLAQVGIFITVINIPLADATAIFFSKPLFTTIIAVFLVSEIVSKRRWSATAIGFLGVIIMVRPGDGSMNLIALVGVAAALTFAIANVLIRVLSRTEPPNRILFYYHIGGIIVFTGPAIFVWQTPIGIEWVLLISVAVLTTIGMTCFVRAFSIGEANAVGPIEYVRLIYAAIFGYFVFSEIPSLWTGVGAILIIASAIYIARDEAKNKAKYNGSQ
ncbi:MAG: DMT family transporter [Pseudomonadota bacterium]|nr:DMT family transporter [Pseudomonadota bacterium]